AVERVEQSSKVGLIKRQRHRVDGEISPVLVVYQCAIFHNRLAGIGAVGFFPCTHKFDLHIAVPKGCCTEVLIYGHLYVQPTTNTRGKIDTTTYHHHVDIVPEIAVHDPVPHIPP